MTQTIDIDFHIKYNMTTTPSVDDVVTSLTALQHLIPKSVTVLDKIYPELTIHTAELLVEDVRAGSLWEDLKVKLTVGLVGEQNAKKLQEILDDSIKNHHMLNKLLYAGFGAVVAFGPITAVQSCSKKEQAVVNNFYDNSTNIAILSEHSNLSGDEVVAVVKSVMDKKTVQKTADFIQPAKQDPNGSIEIGGKTSNPQTIPNEVVQAVPEQVEVPQQEEREQDYSNIDVYIYASDQDKNTQGWAGLVPELFEHRVKFELAEDINPHRLHGQRKINADITVIERYQKSQKKYTVAKVIIRRVAQ